MQRNFSVRKAINAVRISTDVWRKTILYHSYQIGMWQNSTIFFFYFYVLVSLIQQRGEVQNFLPVNVYGLTVTYVIISTQIQSILSDHVFTFITTDCIFFFLSFFPFSLWPACELQIKRNISFNSGNAGKLSIRPSTSTSLETLTSETRCRKTY